MKSFELAPAILLLLGPGCMGPEEDEAFEEDLEAEEFGLSTAPTGIRVIHSLKCLDIAGAAGTPGAPLIQWYCHDGDNQRISLRENNYMAGPSDYSLVVRHSGQCLDVEGGSRSPGARVVQWPCHGGNNQKWRMVTRPYASGLRFVAKHSGLCLDVWGASTQAGAQLVQWYCHDGDNQGFLLRDM